MTRRTMIRGVAIAVSAAISMAPVALAAPAQETRGGGALSLSPRTLTDGAIGEQGFSMQFRQRADGTLVSGPVRLKGVPAFAGGEIGEVDWTQAGSRVTGTVTRQGAVVVTFEGTRDSDGLHGTFSARDGASGEWYWDGEVPRSQ